MRMGFSHNDDVDEAPERATMRSRCCRVRPNPEKGRHLMIRCTRIFASEDGASHVQELEIDLQSHDFAPPAPPVLVSASNAASSVLFISAEAGWYGDWHPVPRRQYMCVLAGELKVETSDGDSRRFSAGSITLVEDTFGSGHRTRVLSDEPVVIVVVQLPD
jgi:quercetin dioxygenase-like cupin family protein